MTFGTYRRTAFAAAVSLLSVAAFAQSGGGRTGLALPESVNFVGKQDPNIRKATAIINGEVITGSDIDHRLALIVASNNSIEIPADEMERIRAQVLRNLIDETLQIQAAAQQDIKVEPREVQAYYARFAERFNQTPEAFGAYLRSIGSSERSIKRQIQGEIAWQRLQRRRIEPFVSVGQEEVQAIIDRLNAARGTREYRVAEIFLSSTPETEAEARANAARIIQQIRGGASFAAYARQFSEASTAAVGGDLGWVRAEQLPDELAAVVGQLPVGAISNPVPLPGGISVVAIQDARQILVADPRDAVLSLMQLSVAFPPGSTQAQVAARAEQLARATQEMGGCGGASQVASSVGAELVTNDQVEARELPPQLQELLLGLNIGQATPPFGSAERVSVLVLCGRDDPEATGGPSFDQVYAQLNEERVNRRAQRYLRDLRRDAVVDYR